MQKPNWTASIKWDCPKRDQETLYWLELLKATDYLTTEQFTEVNADAVEIIKIITTIIKTTKSNIMMANSHVPNATKGGKKVAIIPTWDFDVDYFFHPRWSVALQGDVKLQSFEVEADNVALERTNPFAIAAVLHYHAVRHWSFYIGPGYALESHENFFLVKAGTEYSFEITENSKSP